MMSRCSAFAVAAFLCCQGLCGSLDEPHQQIQDYRVLAQAMDWQALLEDHQRRNRPAPVRLLDIGCGTGRWLDALQRRLSGCDGVVACDLIDLSALALREASDRLKPPFVKGVLFQDYAQQLTLPPDTYDIIWAMHSFYAIAAADVALILDKALHSLREGGDLIVALGSSHSFYNRFYEQYRRSFLGSAAPPYVDAEAVVCALQALGRRPEVSVCEYTEVVSEDDSARLAHYLLNECIGYSYNRDALVTDEMLLDHMLCDPLVGPFLRSCLQDGAYHFKQDTWLIRCTKGP